MPILEPREIYTRPRNTAGTAQMGQVTSEEGTLQEPCEAVGIRARGSFERGLGPLSQVYGPDPAGTCAEK